MIVSLMWLPREEFPLQTGMSDFPVPSGEGENQLKKIRPRPPLQMFQQSLVLTIRLYSISSSIYFFFLTVLYFLPFPMFIFICIYIVDFMYFVLTVPLSLNS